MLAAHTWSDPVERVSTSAKEMGVPLVTPMVGDRFSIKDHPLGQDWWKKLAASSL